MGCRRGLWAPAGRQTGGSGRGRPGRRAGCGQPRAATGPRAPAGTGVG